MNNTPKMHDCSPVSDASTSVHAISTGECARKRIYTKTMALSAIAIALSYEPPAHAQAMQPVQINGGGGPQTYSVKGDDQPPSDDGVAGAAGGSPNGWSVTQGTGVHFVKQSTQSDDTAVITVGSIGGQGGRGGFGEQVPGGNGGAAGDINYTSTPTGLQDGYSLIINEGDGPAISLMTTGGRSGDGGNVSSTYGTGGEAGVAGTAGNITFNMLTDPTRPTAFDEVDYNRGIGIDLASTGGSGGDGSDARNVSTTAYGRQGADGAAGGQILANFATRVLVTPASVDPTRGGTGIQAISTGGDGGDGGNGYVDNGTGHGGVGGAGGNGGPIYLNQYGGGITAFGKAMSTATTVDGGNGDTAATITRVAYGINAVSQGGSGGLGGSGDGDAGVSGAGGAAGNGGDVNVTLLGTGLNVGPDSTTLYNTAVHTAGDYAIGVAATSIGGAGGDTSAVGGGFSKKGGNGGIGGDGQVAAITLGIQAPSGGLPCYKCSTDEPYTLIMTEGSHSDALVAQSIGGGGGNGGSVDGGSAFFSVSTGGHGANGGNGGEADVSNGFWSESDDGSSLVFNDPYVITTSGANSNGIFAQSIGGGGGRGGDAISTGLASLNDLVTLVIGGTPGTNSGTGGAGGSGEKVAVNNYGIVQTSGDQSVGIFSQSVGGGGGVGGGAVSVAVGTGVTLAFAVGGAGGPGGDAGIVETMNLGQVITSGANSDALLSQSIGGGGGKGGTALAEAYSINDPDLPSLTLTSAIGGSGGKGGNGEAVTLVNGGFLSTRGVNSNGVFAQSVGGGGGIGGDATALSQATTQSTITLISAIGGSGGAGGSADAVTVANSGLIHTLGFGSAGVFAQSVGGGGGNGGFGKTNQGAYNAAGDYSLEVNLALGGSGGGGGAGGSIDVYNFVSDTSVPDRTPYYGSLQDGQGAILTMGSSAAGIFAQSVGGGGGNGGFAIGDGGNGQVSVNVAIGGNGGAGGNGNNVNVHNGNGTIATYGANSAGVFAQSIGGGGGNGGSATTGSGNDPQKSYPEFLANQMAPTFGATVDPVTDTIWDWKDNVQGAWSDINRIQELYEAYQKANPAGGLANAGAGLKASDLTVDIGAGRGGKGGVAGDGGNVTVDSAGAILTSGPGSIGIYGQSVGGGGGTGGVATASTINDRLPVAVLQGAVALGGAGGHGGQGGNVALSLLANPVPNKGTGILTLGDLSHGMFAQSIGGGGGMGGISTGKSGNGVIIPVTLGADGKTTGAGGEVDLTSSTVIETRGDDAIAMFAQSVGGGGGYATVTGQVFQPVTGLALTQTQVDTIGTKVQIMNEGNGKGGAANVTLNTGGQIKTTGINSYGILAQSVGGAGGVFIVDSNNGATNSVCAGLFASACSNNQASGQDAGNVTVTTQAATSITTSGAGAVGILAQSLGGGGAIVNGMNGINLDPGANKIEYSGLGNANGNGGHIQINNFADITTTGAYAHGIFAQSASSGGGLIGRADGSGVIFYGQNKAGRSCDPLCQGNVDISLNGGTIDVSGTHAWGVAALALGAVKSSNEQEGVARDEATVTINAGARVLASGDAAGAILIGGSTGATIVNKGTVDASGSKSGVGTYLLVDQWAPPQGQTLMFENYGVFQGSIIGQVANVSGSLGFASLLPKPAVFFNNYDGGVLAAGSTLDLGGGALNNAGHLYIGANGKVAKTVLNGNLTQQPGGTLHIDADLRSGAADKLEVNGTATIAGTVNVQSTSVSNKNAVTVLTATNGVTLDPQLRQTDASPLFDFPVVVTGNALTLSTKARFSDAAVGLGHNQRAVAGHLQQIFDNGGSMDAGFTALSSLSDDTSVAKSLDTLSGHALGVIGATRYASSRAFVNSLQTGCSLLDAPGDGTHCVWSNVQSTNMTQGSTHDALDYTANAQVFQIGSMTAVGTDLAVGVSAALDAGTFRDKDRTARVEGETAMLGANLRYAPGAWEFSGAVEGGYGWYNSRRTIAVGASSEVAKATPKVWQLGTHLRAAYTFDLGKAVTLKPFTDLHAMYVRSSAFTESGNSPFNLDVAQQGDFEVSGAAGVEVAGRIELGDGVAVRPFISGAFEANSNSDWTTSARFAGQTDADRFSVKTATPDLVGRVSVGANLIGSKSFDVSVSYSPEWGQNYNAQSAVGSVTFRF